MHELRIAFAGTIASDRMHSLKFCDHQVVSALKAHSVSVVNIPEQVPFRICHNKIKKLYCKEVIYPRLINRITKNTSVLHIGNQDYSYLLRFSKAPVTITCHDLANLRQTQQSRMQYLLWKSRMKWLPYADHIFCVSKYTARDLVHFFDLDQSKVSVNYNGFFPLSKIDDNNLSPTSLGLLGRKKDSFFVFHPGIVGWRKNIPVLLEAIAQLRRQGIPAVLVKAGDSVYSRHSELVQKLGINRHIIEMGRVSLRVLNELYSICDVLSLPSIHEGFGLPVLEAQSCGLPCVISNATSLPEVGGDAALYHNPFSTDELCEQLERIYTDADLKMDIIHRGFVNVLRFSWEKHANNLIDVFSHFKN